MGAGAGTGHREHSGPQEAAPAEGVLPGTGRAWGEGPERDSAGAE